jgi:lipase chaperone LimK
VGQIASAEDVLRALRAHGVSAFLEDESRQAYTLERGEFFESAILSGEISARYLQYLKRKLDIPIHHFWHPEEAEKERGTQAD